MVEALRERTARANIPRFDAVDRRQGIVHVIGPELGMTLTALSMVCGDSHTCTHGPLGPMAWGIGSSELAHVLAIHTLRQNTHTTTRITQPRTATSMVQVCEQV